MEVARYELNPQYCGTLLYFTQYAEELEHKRQVISNTPGYEWIILCNNQPRAPYLPTRPDIESVGLQRPSYPFEIGRGVHVEVRREKGDAYGR